MQKKILRYKCFSCSMEFEAEIGLENGTIVFEPAMCPWCGELEIVPANAVPLGTVNQN